MQNNAQRKKFNFCFSVLLSSIKKTFILAGRLGTRLLFYEVLRLLSRSAACDGTRIYHVCK